MWNTVTIQYNPLIEEEWDEHFKVNFIDGCVRQFEKNFFLENMKRKVLKSSQCFILYVILQPLKNTYKSHFLASKQFNDNR